MNIGKQMFAGDFNSFDTNELNFNCSAENLVDYARRFDYFKKKFVNVPAGLAFIP
jgi:hypothetical protein